MTEFTQRIRSFVKRESRLTKAQVRAIETLLPQYSLGVPFNNEAPIILEIGFGNGASLLAQAKTQPENNFIGIEVHRPGVGSLLQGMEAEGVENIRISNCDAVEVLEKLPDNCLQGIQLFFPDPWHKKKHHKRRLIQPTFLDLIYSKLLQGGFMHCATDWQDYAEHMLAVFSADTRFENQSESGDYIEKPAHRITTKFEQRGIDRGHGVWDLMFKKGMS